MVKDISWCRKFIQNFFLLYLFILFIYLFIYLFNLFIYLYVYLFIYVDISFKTQKTIPEIHKLH